MDKNKIRKSFYLNSNVVQLAKLLIGKIINTSVNGKHSAAVITETEAYAGIADKASHAYAGKRTLRTETMYADGGIAYVYLCYGMHNLFNIVSNKKDVPDAVLVRAIYPLTGTDEMLMRVNKPIWKDEHGIGPGKVCKLLGITKDLNGISLMGNTIWLSESTIKINEKDIMETTRIGIDYAQEHALLPWRFYISPECVRTHLNKKNEK